MGSVAIFARPADVNHEKVATSSAVPMTSIVAVLKQSGKSIIAKRASQHRNSNLQVRQYIVIRIVVSLPACQRHIFAHL